MVVRLTRMARRTFSLRFAGRFTDDFDTGDMKEAKALLEELAS